jgi:hypothetical protein
MSRTGLRCRDHPPWLALERLMLAIFLQEKKKIFTVRKENVILWNAHEP